jgi:penicillin-binding protein 2
MAEEAIAEEPRATKQVVITGVVFMLGLLVMLARLYQMQVMQHAFWLSKMNTGSEVSVRIPAVRGEIRDRNNVTLAANRPNYAIEFYLPDMVRDYRAEKGDVPRHEYFANVKGMKRMLAEADIVKVVNESAIPRLEEFGLAEDYNSERLRLHFRNKREVPFVYRDGIDFAKFGKYVETGTGLPGVEITNRPARRYPYGSVTSARSGMSRNRKMSASLRFTNRTLRENRRSNTPATNGCAASRERAFCIAARKASLKARSNAKIRSRATTYC